jgi:hypothetical protein
LSGSGRFASRVGKKKKGGPRPEPTYDPQVPKSWTELCPERYGALAATKAKCAFCRLGIHDSLPTSSTNSSGSGVGGVGEVITSEECGPFISPPIITSQSLREMNNIHRSAQV